MLRAANTFTLHRKLLSRWHKFTWEICSHFKMLWYVPYLIVYARNKRCLKCQEMPSEVNGLVAVISFVVISGNIVVKRLVF